MSNPVDTTGKFYLDVHSLDALRLQAQKNPKQALTAVSKQFEGVLMSMMLKSMRDATPQDGPFDSQQTKMYMSMLDQQLVQSLSQKGMGLAEIMVRQFSPPPAVPKPAVVSVPAPVAAAQTPAQAATPPAAAQTQATSVPMADSSDFVAKLLPHALEAEKATGIPAKFMLGQAALETGWGKHVIGSANGRSSHNLFGIKADKHWTGPVVTALTTEYVNGVPRKVYQNFRAYDSYAASFKDYAKMLSGNPRYASVVASSQDAAGFAQGLQSAGYATDPHYSDKLMHMFAQHPLNAVA